MLEKEFEKLYYKFRNNYCKNLFSSVNEDKDSLSPTESYCVEVIFLLNRPTVRQFANYVNISQPNATYRISNLIEKGYVRKVLSLEDRREYFLEVTDKFSKNYGMNASYNAELMATIRENFTKEEIETMEKLLKKLNDIMV
ncbi:MAG: winged helix-turn-helix transcriptional regulator [Clostridiales bacterium]|nr:winged helix-turn-helix transcriptional regulator [Clostridiales bacterium]